MGLDMQNRRENEDLKLASLLSWPICLTDLGGRFPRNACRNWELGYWGELDEENLEVISV